MGMNSVVSERVKQISKDKETGRIFCHDFPLSVNLQEGVRHQHFQLINYR